jgi:hypothetical protein
MLKNEGIESPDRQPKRNAVKYTMTGHRANTQFWLRGGLTGLLFPGSLLGLLEILTCLRIAFWENFLAWYLLFAISLMEMPVVIIGRRLNLPIETGGVAFLLYELSPVGYFLVFLFWGLLGLILGCMVDLTTGR